MLLFLSFTANTSAQKLVCLPGSRGPIWPVLSSLLAEGTKKKEGEEKMIVVAVRSLAGVACVDVCELIQPVIEMMAEDVCRVSRTHNFNFSRISCCNAADVLGAVSAGKAGTV